jgi:hypothetical protein
MTKLLETPVIFASRALGESLTEVQSQKLGEGESQVTGRYFKGDQDTDLSIWVDPTGQVIRQQLVFHGQVVEWNCLEGLRTGITIEEELTPSEKSTRIQFDSSLHKTPIAQALEILASLQAEPKLKAELIKNFEKPEDIRTMAPDKFVQRFSQAAIPSVRQHPMWVLKAIAVKRVFSRLILSIRGFFR